MSKMFSPSYDRAPSLALRQALAEGILAPVVNSSKRSVAGCYLDVHFRVDDAVHVYCGHANLMQIKLKKDRTITVEADPYFRDQACAKELFREWAEEETHFEEALDRYLEKVAVQDRQTRHEGLLQAQWSRVENDPWTPFDRECVLVGMGDEIDSPEVDRAMEILENIRVRSNRGSEPWAELKRPTGSELDQIAVDPDGNLVLIELKDANSDGLASVFYSPLQLLGYVHQWRKALTREPVRESLNDLIDARKNLGLTPNVSSLGGGIRAAICFGDDGRSDEVKRRFYEVLGVVNAHLPSGVKPIETWMLGSEVKPRSL